MIKVFRRDIINRIFRRLSERLFRRDEPNRVFKKERNRVFKVNP